MVEYMRSTVAFALIIVNIALSSLNIFFSIMAINYSPYYRYRYLSSINETLLEKNQNYYIKDILEKEIETPKELRNLSSGIRNAILFINVGAYFFIIFLFATFWMTKNECCNNDEDIVAAFPIGSCNGKCLCCGECKLNYFGECCPNNKECEMISFMLRAFLMAPLFLCVFSYLIVDACGKHACRMTCVIFLMLINLTLTILSFIAGTDTYCILVAVCAFIAFVCNLLSIVLPNCLESLSYYEYEPVWNDEQYYQDEYLEDAIYPGSEEVENDQLNKPATPDNIEQNPGYDNDEINNRNSINSLDAPTPISNKTTGDNLQENNEMKNLENNQQNNQENIPYPSAE